MYKWPKQITSWLMSFILIFSTSFLAKAYDENIEIPAKKLSIKVLSQNNTPLEKMVVYVETLSNNINLRNESTLEIGQQNKSFIPYISVMQLGSSVKFNNKDNITHHIYSPLGKNKFSVKIRSGQQITKSDFKQAGEVSMGCNIHDWMSGYMLIVDTPFFAKTGKNGIAEIDINKSGQYKVVVWHPQMNEANNKIMKTINLDSSMNVKMQLLKPMDEIPTQKNEDDFDFLSDY